MQEFFRFNRNNLYSFAPENQSRTLNSSITMSAFAIFAIFLTVAYAIYYSVLITHDVYGKKDAPKTDDEEIDVSPMQETEEPTPVSESADGFRMGREAQAEAEQQSGVTFISNEEEMEQYQERRKAADECARYESMLEDADVESEGAMDEQDMMATMLANQKPGGPKIFISRDKA